MDAPDAEMLAKNAWAVGFLVTSLQLYALVIAGYLWLIVTTFQKGEKSLGIIFAVLFIFLGGGWVLGVLLGLIIGWTKVARWQIRGFMTGWTILILIASLNLTISILMRKMSRDDWREWFAWLPAF
jgi:hypothetical protein